VVPEIGVLDEEIDDVKSLVYLIEVLKRHLDPPAEAPLANGGTTLI
jgi:hypothetical protein